MGDAETDWKVHAMDKDEPARIPRLAREQRSAAVLEIIDMYSGPGRLNVDDNHVLNTLGQYPELAKAFLGFNRHILMASTLPVRLRQLAIMRVCWVKRARYMWSSHLRTSLRNGFDGTEFEPLKIGASAPVWSREERLIIDATECLVETSTLDDATWEALRSFLDTRQILDFLFTVGCYVNLAIVLNTLRVEREDPLLELAERYGAPE